MRKKYYRLVNQLDNAILHINGSEMLSQNEAMTEMTARAVSHQTKVKKLLALQDGESTVFTKDKQKIRTDCELEGSSIGNRLSAHGAFKEFLPFAELAGYSLANLKSLSAVDLVVHLQHLVDVGQKYLTQAEEADVTEPELTSLSAHIIALDKIKNAPSQYILSRSEITEQINEELDAFSDLLFNTMLKYIRGRYMISMPEVVEGFENALKVPMQKPKKRAITGIILNSETGDALHDVHVTMDNEETKIKGGKKGKFFYQYVDAGVHELVFEHPAFVSQTINIVVYPDETTHIKVELEPLHVVVELEPLHVEAE